MFRKMFETAFPDENTRKLETILAMMKFRRWDAAVSNQNLVSLIYVLT